MSVTAAGVSCLYCYDNLVGIPVSLSVRIYKGVLLGALSARPFWNNPMLPMLFLASALKTGTASICLIGCVVKGFGGMTRRQIETNKFVIHSIDFFLMILRGGFVLRYVVGRHFFKKNRVWKQPTSLRRPVR
jgi:formate-dependent nitrite reductase membrane component NrfD